MLSNDGDDNSCSTVVFLDLPPGTKLTLDGIPLQLPPDRPAPALVGVRSIPKRQPAFHLLTLRCGGNGEGRSSSSTHGFVMLSNESSAAAATTSFVVHRYDPATEEVAGNPVDAITQSNIFRTISKAEQNSTTNNEAQVLLAAIPTYETLLAGQQNKQQPTWHNLTRYISPTLLQLRGLSSSSTNASTKNSSYCIKLVPGVIPDDEVNTATTPTMLPDDAQSLQYPAIPVFPHDNITTPSLRATSHPGTRTFLRNLPPADRTAYYRNDHECPNTKAIRYLLLQQKAFDNTPHHILGDLQLSFLLFWQLHCFASLTHWRDVTALLGNCDEPTAMDVDAAATILVHQLQTQQQFLDEYQDSALVAALHRLGRKHAGLRQLLQQQGLLEVVEEDRGAQRMMDDDDDDDDGPVIVDMTTYDQSVSPLPVPPSDLADAYPLLAAAMLEHEDVLMTCARALDTQADVGLVREAAEYLEQVEAKRMDTEGI